jgi:hypothetical protein
MPRRSPHTVRWTRGQTRNQNRSRAVSEDGQTVVDDRSRGMITIREAAGAVVKEMPTAGAPPVTWIWMGVEAPGFPEGTSGTATPAA